MLHTNVYASTPRLASFIDINIDDDEFHDDEIDGDDDEITEDEIDDDEITDTITGDVINDDEIIDTIVPDVNDIDTFIDTRINDINKLYLSAELYITSGLVYETSSVSNDHDNDNDDGSEATTEDQTDDDITSTNRNEVDTCKSIWTDNFHLTFTSSFECFPNTDTTLCLQRWFVMNYVSIASFVCLFQDLSYHKNLHWFTWKHVYSRRIFHAGYFACLSSMTMGSIHLEERWGVSFVPDTPISNEDGEYSHVHLHIQFRHRSRGQIAMDTEQMGSDKQ